MNKKGVIRLDILGSVAIFLFLIVFVWWSFIQENTKQRDVQRLSDIKQIQSAFELVYRDYGSYSSILCEKNGLISQCQLGKYLPNIVQIKDPNQYQYLVVETPAENSYKISFYLEKTYESLKAGKHYLSENGIE